MAQKVLVRRGEPEASIVAFGDYYELGPSRSLARLVRAYQRRTGDVPTRNITTLKGWSTRWQWAARVEARVQQETSILAEQRANARRSAGEVQGRAAESLLIRTLVQWQRHSEHWTDKDVVATDAEVAKGDKLQTMLERAQKMQRLALGLPTTYTREERDFQLLDFMLQETRSILLEVACPDCLEKLHARYKDLDAMIVAMGGQPMA